MTPHVLCARPALGLCIGSTELLLVPSPQLQLHPNESCGLGGPPWLGGELSPQRHAPLLSRNPP